MWKKTTQPLRIFGHNILDRKHHHYPKWEELWNHIWKRNVLCLAEHIEVWRVRTEKFHLSNVPWPVLKATHQITSKLHDTDDEADHEIDEHIDLHVDCKGHIRDYHEDVFLLLFGKDWFPDITCPLQTKTSQVAVPHVAQERQKFLWQHGKSTPVRF